MSGELFYMQGDKRQDRELWDEFEQGFDPALLRASSVEVLESNGVPAPMAEQLAGIKADAKRRSPKPEKTPEEKLRDAAKQKPAGRKDES